MGLFDRFRTRQIADVALGTLDWRHGTWRGRVTLPGVGEAELWLPGSERAPSEPARAMVVEGLPYHWVALQPAIERALYDHYEPYRDAAGELDLEEVGDAIPAIARAADVWRHVRRPLVRVADTGDDFDVFAEAFDAGC